MVTNRVPTGGCISRLVRAGSTALSVALVGTALTFAPAAVAQNLVQNPNFAISGGSTSFSFGGYFDATDGESLANWSYIPSGTGQNLGAAFDFVSGQTSAYYSGTNGNGTGGSLQQILPLAITAPGGTNFLALDANWGGNVQAPGFSETVGGLVAGATYSLSFAWGLTQWLGYGVAGGGTDTLSWTAMLGSSSQTTSTTSIVTSSTSQTFSGWVTTTFNFVASSTSETLEFLANGTGQPPVALLANVSLTRAPEPMSLALFGTGVVGLIGVAARRRRTAPLAA